MKENNGNSMVIRNNLKEIYQQLPPLKKKLVQLFSVIYVPVSKTELLSCLTPCEIRDENNKAFTNKTLKPYIDNLINLGLIIQKDRQKGPICHPLLTEIATRDAIQSDCFELFVEVVEDKLFSTKSSRREILDAGYFLRRFRICVYRKNLEEMLGEYANYLSFSRLFDNDLMSWDDVILTIFNNPFDGDFLFSFPSDFYEPAIVSILGSSFWDIKNIDEVFNFLYEQCFNHGKYSSDYMRLVLSEQLLLRGKLSETEENLKRISDDASGSAELFWGWLFFLRGENEKAIASCTTAYKSLQKALGKKKIYFGTLGGVFFILALIKEGSAQSLKQAESLANIVAQDDEHWLCDVYKRLVKVIRIQQGDISEKKEITKFAIPYSQPEEYHCFDTLFYALTLYWVDHFEASKSLPKVLGYFLRDAQEANYTWMSMEVGELLARVQPNHKHNLSAEMLLREQGITTLTDLIEPVEEWELSLKALLGLQSEQKSSPSQGGDKRLVWLLAVYGTGWDIHPKEQKINAKGVWSKGRAIALKRLQDNPSEFDYLTAQDLRVCACIEAYRAGYYGSVEYNFSEKAIVRLIGHPLVFWSNNPSVKVEITAGEPELIVRKNSKGQISLEFSPEIDDDDQDVIVVKETPTSVKVITIKEEHRRIKQVFGRKKKLMVPAKGEEMVLKAISRVSQLVTIHSDIGGATENTPEVESHPIPHIHLLPAGEGLKVAVLCRPFGDEGSYYRPGHGGATVIAEIKGQRLQTRRDLNLELKLAQDAIALCPTLNLYDDEGGEWLIQNPEDCLELLLELQNLGEGAIVEWPKGEKLRVTSQADFDKLRLQITSQQDWFSLNGELQLEDDTVLKLQELLTLLENSPSRFVPIGEGQFLALTHEFRQRLEDLKTFSEKQGQGRRFHPLSSLALEEFIDEAGQLKADKKWKNHLEKLRQMENLEPELPSTLQAELRDYQREGFTWLARLSHWGVGACLADDMGLGKTLQALAIILTRAPQGASLIIAPTSVGFNWQSEAEKFAPTLNPILFGSGDRASTLNELQPFDLVICTYGLLQQEEVAEMLAQVHWQTIVLDEAQAIKNIATKRSQGAMKLKGEFKLITTGTPIENHLGELWNLFRFINPGLLGSRERFNQRFAYPIEKNKDKQARQQLKKLIQPFLLRRTKSQVLTELPSRTEITVQVELSQEEMALYEALRREAIQKLNESDSNAGAKHLQVLAEIMRLRRVCCNPSLVMPDASLPSSKLDVFGEILTELLENRHKALVFSQFVDHLKIIEDYLQKNNIIYQYLDGSTSTKERQQRIKAFQAGEGDVFLISLKAGGTGLNLTAADYVIHMDPWWNPAVEDQASDRAHRIGQKRPVTIYRLVAKNTIEEKIVDLHQHKRDLADSLLEGTDVSGKISTEQLLALIKEN